jgi:flagellar M-ring protein FliF
MFSNINEWWKSASLGTRIGLFAGMSVIVLLTVLAFVWAFQDEYQVLFSELNAQDASALVTELDKSKTPYRLADGGNTILVPRDLVYKTRLKLMGQNIPLQGGVGFEIFNNSDFGMTEFAQKVNYQRALQGELARTIMAFDEIKFARVLVVMPESGLFKKRQVSPKASVTLIMKPDAKLRPEQVMGIQRLVAASVPEIQVSSVTVLDQQGVALSRNAPAGADDSGTALQIDLADSLNQQHQVKKQTEAYLTRKLSEVLEKALGPGQAIVTVDVNLNYDQVKVTEESVLAGDNRDGEATGVVVRRRKSVNSAAGFTADPGITRSEGARQTAAPQESSTSEVEYQTGRRIEQIVTTPGSIRRLSVGVLIPGYPTDEKLRRIKDIVKMSAGINLDRGDAVAVYGLDQVASIAKATAPMALPPVVDETGNSAPSAGLEATAPAVDHVQPNAAKPWTWTWNRILISVAILLALVALLYQLLARRQHSGSTPPLTPQQRDEMLREIRTWLNQPATDPSNRGASS